MSPFVDTSALYAVLDRDDANHSRARALWESLIATAQAMVTTNYVVVESTALVQHRLGLRAVRALTDDMLGILDVEWVTRSDHQAATAAMLAAGRRHLSLVDCTSFEVMRRLGLQVAFAFDTHFIEQGFRWPSSQ